MEHLLLQGHAATAHEQHYFSPAPTSAYLATHQDVSSNLEPKVAERAAAARARLAQAAQVRATQQAYLHHQMQEFNTWYAQVSQAHAAESAAPAPDYAEADSSHLQLKPELLAKLNTFPPKAAQITCACKCLRSHPIAQVPVKQQARAHKRTKSEQLSCDYLALILSCLKSAERPAFYNTCLTNLNALEGLTGAQLQQQEQAAAHYAPLTLRTWANQFSGAPKAQLTRAWTYADLSHFECCDYELPQQPKAYDVKRTCLGLSERAQCVTLEAQQAIYDLSLNLNRLQPRYLGPALTKINPLFQLDGVGFIQGLAKLGCSITQRYPLAALLAPQINPTDPTDPTKLQEQVNAYLKSTEAKLTAKLRKQAERNDAQFQKEQEQAQQQALAPKSDHSDPDDQGGSSGSNDSGTPPNDSGNMPGDSGSSEGAAAASSTDSPVDLADHDWFVPVLPESPFGSADAVDPEAHDWFVPVLPESPFGSVDAVAPEDHDWFVPVLPESPFGSEHSADTVDPEDHDWFVPILPESPFGSERAADTVDPVDHSWFVPVLPESPFGSERAADTVDPEDHDWFVPVLPESPFGADSSSAADAFDPEDHDWFVPILPESPFGSERSAESVDPVDHDWFVPVLPESPFGSERSADAVDPSDHSWFVPVLPEFSLSAASQSKSDRVPAADPEDELPWSAPCLPVTDFGLSADPQINVALDYDEVVSAYQQHELTPVMPDLCYLRPIPTALPHAPAFLAQHAQIQHDATNPERWSATFPQLYGSSNAYGYVDLVQPKLVNALDPQCWVGASAGAIPHTFVLPQPICTCDDQGVPQGLVLDMMNQGHAAAATLLKTYSQHDFEAYLATGYLTFEHGLQVFEGFRRTWLNNNGGAGFAVSSDQTAPEYLELSLTDCHSIGADPAELSGYCFAPLPYDVLRIEQMAVESSYATAAHPFGPVATTGLAPYCNAFRYLKQQGSSTDQLSAIEYKLHEAAFKLHWYANRRLNFEYSCALVNPALAASGRQVCYDIHHCDWVANEAQRNILMQARRVEGQLRNDLNTLDQLCAHVPHYQAELDPNEGLGALYAAAQHKQLSLGATAFNYAALPKLPQGKLPPFLSTEDSYRLLQNRALLAAIQTKFSSGSERAELKELRERSIQANLAGSKIRDLIDQNLPEATAKVKGLIDSGMEFLDANEVGAKAKAWLDQGSSKVMDLWGRFTKHN